MRRGAHRRWPSKNELLEETLGAHWKAHRIAMPDTGNLRDDASALLKAASAARARSTALIAVQSSEHFRETGGSFAKMREALGAGHQSAGAILVDRAVQRGELPSMARSERILGLPLDLLRYEIFTTLSPVPTESIVEIVDQVWLPLLRGVDR